jgi:hypothetical protein
MMLTILDTCRRVTKAGRPYVQAAFRSTTKDGHDWLGVATVPDDLVDFVGEIERHVVFGGNGSVYVLPY